MDRPMSRPDPASIRPRGDCLLARAALGDDGPVATFQPTTAGDEGATAKPLNLAGGRVLPEWIDYNGHMMDGYYFVAFTAATDAVLEYLGLGPSYRERTGRTIYTVEGHISFLREVLVGAPLVFTTQILGFDSRRIHLFHSMLHEETGELLATNELMLVHVNQETANVEPMPGEIVAPIQKTAAEHARLPRPHDAGRTISLTQW